jgi:hypothetical protein
MIAREGSRFAEDIEFTIRRGGETVRMMMR